MRQLSIFISIFIMIFSIGGCATPEPQLTSLQQRVMGEKEIEGVYADVFKASVTVLQDKGYMIKTSDFGGGIIYAESPRSAFVFGKGSYQYKVTVNVEKFTENRTKMRMAIDRDIFDMGGEPWNPPFSKIKAGPVQEPELYRDFYGEIQQEMFRRDNLSK